MSQFPRNPPRTGYGSSSSAPYGTRGRIPSEALGQIFSTSIGNVQVRRENSRESRLMGLRTGQLENELNSKDRQLREQHELTQNHKKILEEQAKIIQLRDEELDLYNADLIQLRADFQYNLDLIRLKDEEMARLEASSATAKHQQATLEKQLAITEKKIEQTEKEVMSGLEALGKAKEEIKMRGKVMDDKRAQHFQYMKETQNKLDEAKKEARDRHEELNRAKEAYAAEIDNLKQTQETFVQEHTAAKKQVRAQQDELRTARFKHEEHVEEKFGKYFGYLHQP